LEGGPQAFSVFFHRLNIGLIEPAQLDFFQKIDLSRLPMIFEKTSGGTGSLQLLINRWQGAPDEPTLRKNHKSMLPRLDSILVTLSHAALSAAPRSSTRKDEQH